MTSVVARARRLMPENAKTSFLSSRMKPISPVWLTLSSMDPDSRLDSITNMSLPSWYLKEFAVFLMKDNSPKPLNRHYSTPNSTPTNVTSKSSSRVLTWKEFFMEKSLLTKEITLSSSWKRAWLYAWAASSRMANMKMLKVSQERTNSVYGSTIWILAASVGKFRKSLNLWTSLRASSFYKWQTQMNSTYSLMDLKSQMSLKTPSHSRATSKLVVSMLSSSVVMSNITVERS